MVGKYLYLGATSSSEWIAAGYLLLPFVAGSLFGGVFTYLIRWLGWPRNVISIAPISVMFGVLSYTVTLALMRMVVGSFAPQAIWAGILTTLIFTCPIAFVMGPLLFIYILHLKKGRKILKDSTVFYIAVLCLISEFAFVLLFLNDTS
jgi:hypothetical protein